MTLGNQQLNDFLSSAGNWKLDPARTSIEFHTKAMWVLKVKGSFKAIEGGAAVSEDGAVSGSLVLDAASVNTGNAKRDAHLRTADFFEVEKYPTIVFSATGARPTGSGQVELTGTLTIHGESKPVTLVGHVAGSATEVEVSAESDIDRSGWGITWSKMGAGLANHLVLNAHFARE
jgi:polyisoprenoid-binding protein YceI